MEQYILLPEDRIWLENRLVEIEKQLLELGEEFREATTQSSETYHDNAPFDAARDKQSLIYAEYTNLKRVLNGSQIACRKRTKAIQIGDQVLLEKNQKFSKIFIAGDWSPKTGQVVEGIRFVTAKSPIAQALLGKKPDFKTSFGTIKSVESYEVSS